MARGSLPKPERDGRWCTAPCGPKLTLLLQSETSDGIGQKDRPADQREKTDHDRDDRCLPEAECRDGYGNRKDCEQSGNEAGIALVGLQVTVAEG